MKNNTKLLKIIALILLVSIFGFFLFTNKNNNSDTNEIKQTQNLETTLTIKGVSTSSPIDISAFIGKTALEATLASVKEIKTQGSGTNAYVTSIEGKMADSKKNEFWELTINEKPSEVGAGSYTIKPGDKIIWQINTF